MPWASMYKIHRVDSAAAEGLEPLGTKQKFWFTDAQDQRVLFKAEARGTGEDWAEKVACELSTLLGLPHVHYELACDSANIPGVICVTCAPPPSALILGNQLMFERDRNYPASVRKYNVSEHTTAAVLNVVKNLRAPPSPWADILPDGIATSVEVFLGYVMLDAWIANQDRHHENWGALRINGKLFLAPTFDHGASLARNLSDEERKKRMSSSDKGYQVPSFAARARSAFYASEGQSRPMGTFDAFKSFSRIAPQAAKIWLQRLEAVSEIDVLTILARVPSHRISAIGRLFTCQLLAANRKTLLEDGQT